MPESDEMNLVFIGSSNFGLRCLETCIDYFPELKISGVISAPRTFKISYCPEGVTNILHADVASTAKDNNIPFRMIERSMNESILFEIVKEWKPDLFLVAGWYHMIPRRWRKLAPAYGLHASMLPDYSGGAPLVWAMINGETKTGITLFQMDDGADSGPIVAQKEEVIFPDDTIATLYARIEQRGLELLHETMPRFLNGLLRLEPQDEGKRRIFPQRTPKDGLIDWGNDAGQIDRFIRAQTHPYPGAFSTFNGKPVHIWRTEVIDTKNSEHKIGEIYCVNSDTYRVHCGTGDLQLGEISYESKSYVRHQLFELLGGGGQMLGESPSCLTNLKL